jgi:hypothetical protein
MAETGKKAVSGSVQPTNDPAPDIARREDELPESPQESDKASLLVKTVWPSGQFIVENVPAITSEGTRLTKSQYEAAKKAAEPSGVVLEAEEL